MIESSSGFLVEHFLLIYCVATDNQLMSFCLLCSLCCYFCMGIITPHNPFPLILTKKTLLDQVRGLDGNFHVFSLAWAGFLWQGILCKDGSRMFFVSQECDPSTENFGQVLAVGYSSHTGRAANFTGTSGSCPK